MWFKKSIRFKWEQLKVPSFKSKREEICEFLNNPLINLYQLNMTHSWGQRCFVKQDHKNESSYIVGVEVNQ